MAPGSPMQNVRNQWSFCVPGEILTSKRDGLLAQCVEVAPVLGQVLQDGLELQDHIAFVNKGKLLADPRIDNIT
jgi:hypothetical protein